MPNHKIGRVRYQKRSNYKLGETKEIEYQIVPKLSRTKG
jgi:hypothetical protein